MHKRQRLDEMGAKASTSSAVDDTVSWWFNAAPSGGGFENVLMFNPNWGTDPILLFFSQGLKPPTR